MCSIKIHPKIIEHQDKLHRHCLWRKRIYVDGVVKDNSLAAWDMVCKPKAKGGMGIMDLNLQNKSLLLKQLHKFYNKKWHPLDSIDMIDLLCLQGASCQ